MLKVTLEFDTVEAAIVALGKIAGIAKVRAAAGASAASVPTPPVAPAAEAVKPAEGAKRRGRPRKDAAGAGAQPDNASAATTPAAVPAAPTTGPAAGDAPSGNTGAVQQTEPKAAAAPAAQQAPAAGPVPSQEEVVAALEPYATKKGLIEARNLLSRYGVQRARELLPEQRADFIAECKKGIA